MPVPRSSETPAPSPPRLPSEGLDSQFLLNTLSSIPFDRNFRLPGLGGSGFWSDIKDTPWGTCTACYAQGKQAPLLLCYRVAVLGLFG